MNRPVSMLRDLLGKLAIISAGMTLVGCVIALIVKYQLDYAKVYGGFMAICGLLLVGSGVKIGSTPEGRRLIWNPPPVVLGLSIVAGAALYSVFQGAIWLSLSLAVPVFVAILCARLRAPSRRG